MSDAKGFTLLEVIIALAVIATAMFALLGAINVQLDTQAALAERNLAALVAEEALNEIRLTNPRPAVGRSSGRMTMGRQDWSWIADINGTQEPKLNRIDITVASIDTPEDPIYTLTGFARAPDL